MPCLCEIFHMIFLSLHFKYAHSLLICRVSCMPTAPKGRSVWLPFFFLLDLICHHQAWHEAWSRMFLSLFFIFFCERGQWKETKKPCQKAAPCLEPIKVAFFPEIVTAATLTALFSFDPGSAIGLSVFCSVYFIYLFAVKGNSWIIMF